MKKWLRKIWFKIIGRKIHMAVDISNDIDHSVVVTYYVRDGKRIILSMDTLELNASQKMIYETMQKHISEGMHVTKVRHHGFQLCSQRETYKNFVKMIEENKVVIPK